MASRVPFRYFLGLLCFLPLAAPWARPQAPEVAQAALEPALVQALDLLQPARFAEELAWWAAEERDGREAGTPAADEVAARAAWQFTQLGLQPMGDRLAGKPSFYQEFPLTSRGRAPVPLRAVDPKQARLRLGGKWLAMETDWALLGGPDRVRVKPAGLVFFGRGDDDRALVDAGLEGKAAIMWETVRPSPDPEGRAQWVAGLREQAKRATEFGAVALLLVPAPGVERPLHLIRQNLLGSRDLRIPVVQLSREAGQTLLSRIDLDEQAELLTRAIPGAALEMDWEPTEERKGKNVVAFWPGSDPRLSKEFIVIGAHRDHLGVGHFGSRARRRAGEVHSGADDNASGSVGVLQLAQAFASSGLRPRRSLVFALFDAEEMGLVGSRYWVANPPVPIKQVVAMINLDMIGRSSEQRCMVLGTATSPVWPELLREASQDSPLAFQATGATFGGSDHMPFEARGIPVLFFFTGMNPQYHTPDDTADLCDPEMTTEILKVVLRLVMRVADESKRPPFQGRPAAPSAPRIQLGIQPRQTNEGIVVQQVTAGSGAAEAGLQEGDLLVAVDGRAVKRISDLFAILRRKTKGQTVELAWRRGAREMTGTARLK